MNLVHRWICKSGYWRSTVQNAILPWVLDSVELGSRVLEIGPGPGITTELLHARVRELTCVEINAEYAAALSRRYVGQNVRVLCEDGAATSFPDASFDAAVCFTMLHHVPSVAQQDRLMREAARVLRPGGIFAGTDSLSSPVFRLLHLFDTMVVVDPKTLPNRLIAAGFEHVQVDVNEHAFRFRAQKPV